MAVNNLSKYTNADGLGFPLNFRRGNPNPLDNTEVWASFEEAQAYARSNPTAYVSQSLKVINGDDVDYYVIKNAAGDLKKVGSDAGGSAYIIGSGLKLNTSTNTLSVDTTDVPAETDARPITSQGVYNEFAVINALLKTI